MADNRNLEIVRTAYESYRRGDLDAVLDALADDAEWHSVSPETAFPWAGTVRGRDAVRRWFGLLAERATIERFDIRHVIAHGEWIVGMSDVTARSNRSGRADRFDKVDLFRIRGGKIAEFHGFYDAARAVALFGDAG